MAGEVAARRPKRVIPKMAPTLTLTKPTALAVVLHRWEVSDLPETCTYAPVFTD